MRRSSAEIARVTQPLGRDQAGAQQLDEGGARADRHRFQQPGDPLREADAHGERERHGVSNRHRKRCQLAAALFAPAVSVQRQPQARGSRRKQGGGRAVRSSCQALCERHAKYFPGIRRGRTRPRGERECLNLSIGQRGESIAGAYCPINAGCFRHALPAISPPSTTIA